MNAKTGASNTGTAEMAADAESITVRGTSTNLQSSAQGSQKHFGKAKATETPEKFKAALADLDAERTSLAKAAIDQLKPGRPFDPAAVRKINDIERKKNRLLVSRFAFLLRRSSADIQAIVHQIIEL